MVDIDNRQKKCNVCNREYTSTHTEVRPGEVIYVCNKCLEAAKDNFIFICMSCGKVYLRPKKMLIERTKNFELKKAYMLCEDMQIIQGIDMCISCDPQGIVNYMNSEKTAMEC